MNTLSTFNPKVFDQDIFGNTDNGNIKIVYDKEALVNSLKLWIASYQGDFIGLNTRGGYVRKAIGRPMTETDAMDVYHAIITGLKNDFRPALEIVDLSVIPNLKKRRWDIKLDAYAPSLKERIYIQESLK